MHLWTQHIINLIYRTVYGWVIMHTDRPLVAAFRTRCCLRECTYTLHGNVHTAACICVHARCGGTAATRLCADCAAAWEADAACMRPPEALESAPGCACVRVCVPCIRKCCQRWRWCAPKPWARLAFCGIQWRCFARVFPQQRYQPLQPCPCHTHSRPHRRRSSRRPLRSRHGTPRCHRTWATAACRQAFFSCIHHHSRMLARPLLMSV